MRSEKNCHILFLYWGDEDKVDLKRGLKNLVNDLQELEEAGNTISIPQVVDRKETTINVTIKLWLTCDMVCLCKILGLGCVYKHNSTYCCPWCEVTRAEIADFNVEEWDFRDIHQMAEAGKKQEKKKDPKPGDEKGVIVRES